MKARLLVVSLFALPTFAGDFNITTDINDHCAISLRSGIRLESKAVVVNGKDGVQWQLNNGELKKDGQSVALSASEKQKVRDLENDLRKTVPMVAELTHEGLDVAKEAVTAAYGVLLGPDDNSVARIRTKFDRLQTEVGKRVTTTELPADKFDENGDLDLIGDGTSLGMTIGSATLEFLGDVFKAVFNEEYAKELEARADKMEKEVEKQLQARADNLEDKADALCAVIDHAEHTQSALQQNRAASSMRIFSRDEQRVVSK